MLARPPTLKLNLLQCSPQSLKAVLKKYYNSLLYKVVCQVPNKKTQSERFQLMLNILTDPRELGQALDLYGLKLQDEAGDKDSIEDHHSDASVSCALTETNKAYYNYVLDKAWAADILQTESQFWDFLGLLMEHGHKLKSSFWQANPLQSKRVDFC